MTLPHASAAIAARGSDAEVAWAKESVAKYRSIDHLVELAPGELRRDYPGVCARIGKHKAGVEIVVVGWSEKQQRMRALFTRDRNLPTPFDFHPARMIFCPETAGSKDFDSQADPTAWLLKTMSEQRAVTKNENGYFTIGGRAVLTTVTNETITQRVIHVWPDTLRDVIKP